jgi:hypothetical protein
VALASISLAFAATVGSRALKLSQNIRRVAAKFRPSQKRSKGMSSATALIYINLYKFEQ